METKLRSFIKAITYRTLGSLTTAAVAWIITRKGTVAISIGLLDVTVKICAYFIHERLWDHIKFGRIEKSVFTQIAKPANSNLPDEELLPKKLGRLGPVPD